MKKLILLLVLCFAINGCDKDECECYYSNEIGQYVRSEWMAEHHLDGSSVLSKEQLEAVEDECHAKDCN